MDKKLQDLVWSVLPKEFKEEVKKLYVEIEVELSKKKGATDNRTWQFRGMESLLAYLFGIHNLTSDAEGEVELLHVTRQKVMGLYANAKKLHNLYTSATCINEAESRTIDRTDGTMWVLKNLFGSKCLPDEEPKPAEPKFKVGDIVLCRGSKCKITDCFTEPHYYLTYADGKYRGQFLGLNRESDLEPYTAPTAKNPKETAKTFASDEPTDTESDDFDRIVNDSFRGHNRLHIAAMAMQGILANSDEVYRAETCTETKQTPQAIAKYALACADALIAECERTDKLKGE